MKRTGNSVLHQHPRAMTVACHQRYCYGRGLPLAFVLALTLIAVSSAFVAMAAELTFDLKVEHGRVPESMRLVRVEQGDVVRLRWTTDQPLVVHLHGYDIEQRIERGMVTDLTFTAYATGRFPIEVHPPPERRGSQTHEDRALVDVEVYPR